MKRTPRMFPLLAAVVLSQPYGAWPQQAVRLPLVGILSDGGPTTCGSGAPGFAVACMVEALRVLGDVEGRTVAFEYRFAHGDYRRMHALAAELVALRPDVVYTYATAGADAVAKATTTIPVVVGPVGDETMSRLAGNLARPVGNLTGQTLGGFEVNQKCLQLLKELAPRTSRVAVIHHPDNPILVRILDDLGPAAAQLGMTLVRIGAHSAADLPQALAAVLASNADAIFMFSEGPLANSGEVRKHVSAWAVSRRLPVAGSVESFAADGALVSLSSDGTAIARRAAFYVHRILGGAKPADLPVERPTTFKLAVNRRTAAALGLTIPQSVLLRADEVIE
jgi:putative ABC transport system substrate-binding protein